ncbi:glycine zipper 2TM domain-containing protein [Iodobacter fluviatilis]|uniref:Glycine zipper 2TM protein n=1 Tax=Iodobacter fluviatilis TaxID=537 RepID=A0A377SUE1_9NEIS|nr:glycine zipper 2TM domain-containing protein [Iodobacter fluviatilis]TCU88141.1 glycine zipper 2TM protein [Iodobacter fluviatilis]STR45642.1 Surface antigen [Iodobacter fluviatilis]
MSEPKTHPLFLAAAASVILASGVGMANWLGFIGKPAAEPQAVVASAPAVASAPVLALLATPAPTALPTALPVPTAAPAPAPVAKPHPTPKPKPVVTKPVAKPAEVAQPDPTLRPLPPKEICRSCGRVISIRSIEKKGEASGGGAVAGGVLGGVIGHQIGGGNGRTVAEVLGAIGGAVAGHQAEKQYRSVTVYEVRVSFEDESERTYSFQERPPFNQGDRVRTSGDSIVQSGN